MPESHPSPLHLDVVAARSAARLYREAVARGVPEGTAWADAVVLFMIHHPAWPLPRVEAEAARTVGALIRREDVDGVARGAAEGGRKVPPRGLLQALSRPLTAELVANMEDNREAAQRGLEVGREERRQIGFLRFESLVSAHAVHLY